jgi:hypothetical protein
MGCFLSCFRQAGNTDLVLDPRADRSSLILTENMSTQAALAVRVPPAPLLKEINFAAIADVDPEQGGEESDTDLDEAEVEKLLGEEDSG